jgi:asparagine synthase (glutamine-hydrolysing)
MTDTLEHRGPDESGMFLDQEAGVALGHRRLSIIDLSSGQQPMSNTTGDITIVFNGEIYNFPSLKEELKDKGHSFHTTSDTEVIIYLYQEYGERAFARLNGIFAFALYDARNRKVVLARDHFGVKPLYYARPSQSLVFGSEIKAILQSGLVQRNLDLEALNSFLTFRYNPSPQTLFCEIRKLAPGHFLSMDSSGKMRMESYWEYSPCTNTKISESEAIVEYRRLLQAAVRRQMISDVPIGLLLSGGIDSAAIGYLMQHESSKPIETFTVGFEGTGDYNEIADARATALFLGTQHNEMKISQREYLDFFFHSFYNTEEPIAETTIPALYYVSNLAARHLKVVLAGQGADEPLGGYKRYLGEKFLANFGPLVSILPLKLIASIFPRNERLMRTAYASGFHSDVDRFLGIYTIFTPEDKRHLLLPEVSREMADVDFEIVNRLYCQTSHLSDSLAKLLYIDTRMMLPDDLLLFGDKMTMANSLEMRVPFLDVELVQFLETLPSSLKIRGTIQKYIHKKALAGWLPSEIISRKKRGFATPMDQWLQTNLAFIVRKLINRPDSASRMYFDVAYINKMIGDHQSRSHNYQRHIFAILAFELWHITFFQSTIIDLESILYAN